MEKKIANYAQRARNRALWRKDLREPGRENSRCIDRMRMRYTSPELPPTQEWCAGGRAVQLLIDNPGMIIQGHPELDDSTAVGWAMGTRETEEDHSEYPCSVRAITDVNLSAFLGFYDLIEQTYGVDENTMRAIESASDERIPMREIAGMIPRAR